MIKIKYKAFNYTNLKKTLDQHTLDGMSCFFIFFKKKSLFIFFL